MDTKNLRDESDADFLVEYFQNLLARAALDQFAVKFETLDCLTAPDRNTQIQWLVLSGVVLTRLCLRDDDVFDLGSRQGILGSEGCKIHQPDSSTHPFLRSIRQPRIHPRHFRTASSLVRRR